MRRSEAQDATGSRGRDAGSATVATVADVRDGAVAPLVEPFPQLPFLVSLPVFEGPFDLLLGLIARHKLDVTEVALARVTDDFLAFIRRDGRAWDLGKATEFLVIAATLLDLKAARLLPSAEVEDEDDLALLESRDLLFARLLQYRAFKDVAAVLSDRFAAESGRYPRAVGLDPALAGLLPEVVMGLGPDEFAALAGRVLAPRPAPQVALDHLHAPAVSVHEQAVLLIERLRREGAATFRALIAGAAGTHVVVGRFLALLELYREARVAFEQAEPLAELWVRWVASPADDVHPDDVHPDDPHPDDVDPDDAHPDDVDPGDVQLARLGAEFDGVAAAFGTVRRLEEAR